MEKDDDGREFVRCRLAARGFKPTREGPRDDLFAAMPPLEAKKALFAYVPGVREKRRKQGSGRSEAHVHRREERGLQREIR